MVGLMTDILLDISKKLLFHLVLCTRHKLLEKAHNDLKQAFDKLLGFASSRLYSVLSIVKCRLFSKVLFIRDKLVALCNIFDKVKFRVADFRLNNSSLCHKSLESRQVIRLKKPETRRLACHMLRGLFNGLFGKRSMNCNNGNLPYNKSRGILCQTLKTVKDKIAIKATGVENFGH